MIKVSLRGKKQLFSQLVRMERNVRISSNEFTRDAAEWLKNDIQSHWSSRSPSAKGSPPAVVTGNLDSSILVEKTGRGVGGRFAGKDSIYHYLKIDTTKGIAPSEQGYSRVLEEGYDRMFLEPALDRLGGEIPSLAKRTIKIL